MHPPAGEPDRPPVARILIHEFREGKNAGTTDSFRRRWERVGIIIGFSGSRRVRGFHRGDWVPTRRTAGRPGPIDKEPQ